MSLVKAKALDSPKICIIRLGAVGDVVRTIPVLSILKREYPKSEIYWIVEKWASNILEKHPDITEIITIPRKKWASQLKRLYSIINVLIEVRKFKKYIREKQFDIVLDFHGIFKSGLVSKFTKSSVRIGYSKKFCKEFNHFFQNVHVDASGVNITRIEKNLNLLRPLVYDIDTSEELEYNIYISEDDKSYIDDFIKENGIENKKIIGINCGVSSYKSYKEWPLDYYVELIKLINQYEIDTYFILTWGPGEKEKVDYISDQCSMDTVITAPITNLKQLAYLLTKFKNFVTGDTGPMHISAAMKTPTLSIFGPSDPLINIPWGKGHRSAWLDVGCNPCRKRKCKKLECIKKLLPEKVFSIYKQMDRNEET